jgi:hypothetical protein
VGPGEGIDAADIDRDVCPVADLPTVTVPA